MADHFRVASFNVENLFGRAKAINLDNPQVGDSILADIAKFQKLLKKKNYTTSIKQQIFSMYDGQLKEYINVRENRGKLFQRNGWAVVGVKADGKGDWDGEIEFKRDDFSETGRKNTAKVIKDLKADLLCMVEVENRPTLRAFDTDLLNSRYKYEMLIDANDPRGIDVGLYSKYPLDRIWTHMFDKAGTKQVFSRDCLEVEVWLPDGQPVYILCNHFKSRGYGSASTSAQKRERQATRVAEILNDGYTLTSDWVIVAGDLNDSPTSAPLQPLLTVPNLYDVLEQQFPNAPMQRWTYHYKKKFEQIDFILVSKPLKNRLSKAGVLRKGMYELKKLTTSSNGVVPVEKEYKKVTHWTNAASDHGAVWAEFDLT